MNVDRTYLFVPPEEKAEVQALGAHWDAERMCWYVGSGEAPARFSKWLAAEEEGFTIASSHASVASASVSCWKCRSKIEVICIHCDSGTASGEPLTHFTVSDVSAMDDSLARQLAPWPDFRRIDAPRSEERNFANHCRHCGVPQEDLYLHSEPDEPFFDIPHAPAGSINLTPLLGPIQLSGDEHFGID